MPKRPSAEELNAQFEMFEASVEGDLYDPARWANFYRPYGVDLGAEYNQATNSGSNDSTPAPKAAAKAPATKAPEAPEQDDDIPFEKPVQPATPAQKPKQDASDILAMIRNRKTD
jgi:single-stranded DNA-binding protein